MLFPTLKKKKFGVKKNRGGGGGVLTHLMFSSCFFCMIFSKLCRYVHQVMGVCCIVFDIDGMLFEFFMNFLNMEKNKILRFFLFKISCFLHVSCYFQH